MSFAIVIFGFWTLQSGQVEELYAAKLCLCSHGKAMVLTAPLPCDGLCGHACFHRASETDKQGQQVTVSEGVFGHWATIVTPT